MAFYTYLWLREDGSPYYVGKGSGTRAYKSTKDHRPPKDPSRISLQYWADEDTSKAFEIYQIDFWGRHDLGLGRLRNRTNGGDGTSGAIGWNKGLKGVQRHSEETKQKIAKAKHNISDETRKKLSEAAKRKTLSEETKKKIGEASRKNMTEEAKKHLSALMMGNKFGVGNKNKSPRMLGKKHSEETKIKMSEASKAAWEKRKNTWHCLRFH